MPKNNAILLSAVGFSKVKFDEYNGFKRKLFTLQCNRFIYMKLNYSSKFL